MYLRPLLLCCLLYGGGCATTGVDPADVVSGKAPVGAIVERADQAAAAGDYHAASILYQQALGKRPDAEVWYRLGAAYAQLGQEERGIWAYRNALRLEPDHGPSLQAVGFYFTTRDLPDEARPYLERLLELQPDNWRAQNALGVVADLQGRFDAAVGHYGRAIELNPGSPMLWNNLGYSYYMAGDYDAAWEHIARALQMDPQYDGARHNLALVLARHAHYDEALRVMLGGGVEEAQAYCDLGYLAFKMGDFQAAEDMLMEAIRRSATYHRQAHRNLAAVREAMVAAGKG